MFKISFRIAFIFSLLLTLLSAADIYSAKVDSALFLFTNNDFYAAELAFSTLKPAFPDDPILDFYLLNCRYNRLKYDGEKISADALFLNEVPKLVRQFELYENLSGFSALHRLYKGVTYSLLSRVYMGQSEYVAALSNGMKAIRAVNRAHDADAALWDAYLAMGTFDYFGGVMADHYSAVRLVMNGVQKRRKGIDELTLAWEKGHLGRWEAGGLLLMIELYENQNDDRAAQLGRELIQRFPGNMDAAAETIEALIYHGHIDSARLLLAAFPEKYSRFQPKGQEVWIIREHYLRGVLAMETGNFMAAKNEFRHVINQYNLEFRWHLALSYLKLGQMADLEQHRDEAIKNYQHCIALKETTRATQDAEKYLKIPYSP